MTRVYRSPAAERDLQEIWLMIAAENPAAADRILRELGARITGLADHPRIGPRRPDIRPTARMLVEGRYLILFETHPNTDEGPIDQVDIIRIIDGRRDLFNLI